MKKMSWNDAVRLALTAALTGVAMLGGGLLASGASECRADSLWPKRNPQRSQLLHDTRARHVGDLLTLVISESTTVGNREDTALRKSSGMSSDFDFDSSSGGGFGTHAASAASELSNNSARTFSGGATYQDSRKFTDQITVTVVDVLPNGNLIISGQRSLMIAGEQRTLAVSGMVRPIDLGPDNRIHSRYVADFRSVYEGEGASKSFSRQGWFSRAANRIWPF